MAPFYCYLTVAFWSTIAASSYHYEAEIPKCKVLTSSNRYVYRENEQSILRLTEKAVAIDFGPYQYHANIFLW